MSNNCHCLVKNACDLSQTLCDNTNYNSDQKCYQLCCLWQKHFTNITYSSTQYLVHTILSTKYIQFNLSFLDHMYIYIYIDTLIYIFIYTVCANLCMCMGVHVRILCWASMDTSVLK